MAASLHTTGATTASRACDRHGPSSTGFALLPALLPLGKPCRSPIPQYAALMADAQAFKIHPVRAIDPANAEVIVRAPHHDAYRLDVIAADHL